MNIIISIISLYYENRDKILLSLLFMSVLLLANVFISFKKRNTC